MPGILSDYITEPPPFMAGSTAIDKAISDIWEKRKADEINRINAAQQEANASYQQGSNQVAQMNAIETARHNRGTEAHSRGTLTRDRANDQLKYIESVAKAYNDGSPQLGDALSAAAGLFGLTPQVMAAKVAEARAQGAQNMEGVPVQGDPNAATRGPEPGVVMGPPQSNNGSAVAGGQPMTPPYAAPATPPAAPPVDTAASPPGTTPLPQAAPEVTAQTPVDPQAELNAPKPAAPPQPPVQPPPASAAPPAQAAPPAAPPAAQGGVRREDIHIQPKPPNQLGVAPAVASGTPAKLPAMPYAGDPSKHPIAQEANPNWEGQAPTQFPGGQPRPTGTPEAGPVGGGHVAPGGMDPATERQWLQRGFAGRGVLPDGRAIMAGNAEQLRVSAQPWIDYAQDAHELGLAMAAIDSAAAASQTMPPDEAYKRAEAQLMRMIGMHRSQQRTDTQAGAVAGRHADSQERMKAQNYLQRQKEILVGSGIKNDIEANRTLLTIRNLLEHPNPTSHDWQFSVRLALGAMKNKGASTDQDAMASEGKSSLDIATQIEVALDEYISGVSDILVTSMVDTIRNIHTHLLDRTRDEYEFARDNMGSAPNPYAEQQWRSDLQTWYKTFGWSLAQFERDRGTATKPRAAKRKAAAASAAATTTTAPSSGGDDDDLDTKIEKLGGSINKGRD
jgi:hypothetical protein